MERTIKREQAPQARPGISTVGCLRRIDRAKWAEVVAQALIAANGSVTKAAAILGVSVRTAKRQIRHFRHEVQVRPAA